MFDTPDFELPMEEAKEPGENQSRHSGKQNRSQSQSRNPTLDQRAVQRHRRAFMKCNHMIGITEEPDSRGNCGSAEKT